MVCQFFNIDIDERAILLSMALFCEVIFESYGNLSLFHGHLLIPSTN